MTSRERILTALAHREPDRVAIDLGSTEASGIALHAYCRLKETLGLQGKARLFNVKQMLADVESEVLSVLGGDVVPLRGRTSAFGTDICHWKKWVSPWGDNCLVPKNFDPILMPDGSYELHSGGEAVGRMPKDGFYFNVNYRYPLSEARTYKDVECICIRRESALDDENVNDFGKRARELFEKTDKAIIYRGEGALFDKLRSFWTYEKAMVLLYEDPNLIEYFLDILAENAVQSYSQLLPAIKDFVQVIVIADDLGTQTGLPISPEMYRRFIIPRQRKIFKYIKEHSDCYVMLHSDEGFLK